MQDLDKLKASILGTPYGDEPLYSYERFPHLIQLAIAERLDGILTVLKDVTTYGGNTQNTIRLKVSNKDAV